MMAGSGVAPDGQVRDQVQNVCIKGKAGAALLQGARRTPCNVQGFCDCGGDRLVASDAEGVNSIFMVYYGKSFFILLILSR